MSDFQVYAHVRKDPCKTCGKPLTFSTQFKKFGEHRVEVCEWCKLEWHNQDAPGPVEVGDG